MDFLIDRKTLQGLILIITIVVAMVVAGTIDYTDAVISEMGYEKKEEIKSIIGSEATDREIVNYYMSNR